MSNNSNWHGTTIVLIRKGKDVVVAGDGQVSLGNTVIKSTAKKVRKIEIKTRKLSDHIFGGEYHSTFKGRGMTFSEVRQYQIGDDVRTIDWNVTARYNEPFVKIFEEERELTMMLIVDISGSEFYGTSSTFKNEY